jgi:hypothetical protein
MKKILLVCMTVLMVVTCAAQGFGRRAVAIPFELIHTDAAFRQFKKAKKATQAEILNEFLRQANEEYKACETIDEVRDLREDVVLIQRYLYSGKQKWQTHFLSAQKEYNLLFNKINKTIREYEGGTTVYNETGGYVDTNAY